SRKRTTATANDGWMPMYAASTNKHVEVAELLLGKVSVGSSKTDHFDHMPHILVGA
ncbi:hypothetical protein B0T10DRAFT_420245, partial [Thelonectria olida]